MKITGSVTIKVCLTAKFPKAAIHLLIIFPAFAGCSGDRSAVLYETWVLTFKYIHFQSRENELSN